MCIKHTVASLLHHYVKPLLYAATYVRSIIFEREVCYLELTTDTS